MNPDKEKSWFIDVNAMCGKSSHFSLRGMGFVSSMLQYYIFELLVASEECSNEQNHFFKISRKFLYRLLWIDYWNNGYGPQLVHFSVF